MNESMKKSRPGYIYITFFSKRLTSHGSVLLWLWFDVRTYMIIPERFSLFHIFILRDTNRPTSIEQLTLQANCEYAAKSFFFFLYLFVNTKPRSHGFARWLADILIRLSHRHVGHEYQRISRICEIIRSIKKSPIRRIYFFSLQFRITRIL